MDLVEPKAATLHANWISRQQPLSYSASLGVLWCTTGFKVLMHSNLNSYQNFFLTRYLFIHLSLTVAKLQKYVMIYSQWQMAKISSSQQGVWKALKWCFWRAATSNAPKCIDLRKKVKGEYITITQGINWKALLKTKSRLMVVVMPQTYYEGTS